MTSVLLAVGFPLLPLGLEWLFEPTLTDKTVLISAIMYCSALSVVSRSVWIFGLGFVSSILLSIFFGITFYNDEQGPAHSSAFGGLCIFFFAACHIFERFEMHVIRGQNFIEFGKAQ